MANHECRQDHTRFQRRCAARNIANVREVYGAFRPMLIQNDPKLYFHNMHSSSSSSIRRNRLERLACAGAHSAPDPMSFSVRRKGSMWVARVGEELTSFGPECWRRSPLPYATAHARVLHNIRSTPTDVDPKLCFHTMHSLSSCGISGVSRGSATKQGGTASRCRGTFCTRRAHQLPTMRRLGSSVPS